MTKTSSMTAGDTLQLNPTWSSGSDAIATVSDSGLVTAVSPGTVEIYCTVGELSVATVVSVAAAPPAEQPESNQPLTENADV